MALDISLLKCSLTDKIMLNPVIDLSDGESYEREERENQIKENSTLKPQKDASESENYSNNSLIRNKELAKQIEKFLTKNIGNKFTFLPILKINSKKLYQIKIKFI